MLKDLNKLLKKALQKEKLFLEKNIYALFNLSDDPSSDSGHYRPRMSYCSYLPFTSNMTNNGCPQYSCNILVALGKFCLCGVYSTTYLITFIE